MYLTINSRHFLLSCNPFWRSTIFLDTIGPFSSVCHIGLFPHDLKMFRRAWYIIIEIYPIFQFHKLRIIFHSFLYQFQVQGKDPSVDFTQDIVEESEDERCFDEISDSVPTIDLPPCEIGKLEEISELVSSCLPSPVRREKLASAIENEGNFIYLLKVLNDIYI